MKRSTEKPIVGNFNTVLPETDSLKQLKVNKGIKNLKNIINYIEQ